MFSSSQFHSDFATWTVSTHEIGINGFSMSCLVSIEALAALIKEPHDNLFSWRPVEPTSVNFVITRENDDVFKVHIRSSLILSCHCVRCLEPRNHNINIDFVITMMRQEEYNPDEKAGDYNFDSNCVEINDDESTVGYFSDHIDLALILREEIYLKVPDYPECESPTVMDKATCKASSALLSTQMSTRENPFVKFWKKN